MRPDETRGACDKLLISDDLGMKTSWTSRWNELTVLLELTEVVRRILSVFGWFVPSHTPMLITLVFGLTEFRLNILEPLYSPHKDRNKGLERLRFILCS